MKLNGANPVSATSEVSAPPRFLTLLVAAALAASVLAIALGPRVMAERPVPTPDLRATGLTDVPQLVTPFQISSEDHDRMITVIGGYADPARTVLFLRVSPDAGVPELTLFDDQGMMDSSGYTLSGAPGDYVFVLTHGPRVGPHEIAHLRAEVAALGAPPLFPSSQPQEIRGNWTLAVELLVQPATTVPHEAAFALGNWTVTIETLEVTPVVVHLQAVIDGARIEDFGPGSESTITLKTPQGELLSSVTFETGVTVSKEQLDPTAGPPSRSRVNVQWLRPKSGGTYQLRFLGVGRETHTIGIAIHAAQPS